MKIRRRAKLSLAQKIWTAVCRFAFRHAYKRGPIPTGLPGHRDPDSICDQYLPVKQPSGNGLCESDGHYLCSGCEWISEDRLKELSE